MNWPGLPILVQVAGRPIILVGEGEAADAKRRLLERAGATVVGDHPEARLAVVAVDDESEAFAAVERLRARGLLVNAVDRPAWCDFTLPAVVDRAPVLIAIATGGVSAGLAAALRQRLEGVVPSSLGALALGLQRARAALRVRYPDGAVRRRAIGTALGGPLDPFDPGAAGRVEAVLLATADAAEDAAGVTMVLASRDPDELTLRHARVLAMADSVFHAADVPAAILDRARADAARIACAAPPARIAAGSVWVEMAPVETER